MSYTPTVGCLRHERRRGHTPRARPRPDSSYAFGTVIDTETHRILHRVRVRETGATSICSTVGVERKETCTPRDCSVGIARERPIVSDGCHISPWSGRRHAITCRFARKGAPTKLAIQQELQVGRAKHAVFSSGGYKLYRHYRSESERKTTRRPHQQAAL